MDSELKHGLENLKRLREEAKGIGEEITDVQNAMIPMIKKEDPEQEGVAITVDGGSFSARWQQNAAPESWDFETLIPYLKQIGMWNRVKTEILDQAKLEAEIRAGNLSIRDLRKFKLKGDRPRPYIRFFEVKRRVVRRIRKK